MEESAKVGKFDLVDTLTIEGGYLTNAGALSAASRIADALLLTIAVADAEEHDATKAEARLRILQSNVLSVSHEVFIEVQAVPLTGSYSCAQERKNLNSHIKL